MTSGPIATPQLRRYRWPKTVVARFVAKRTLRSAVLWAFIFGAYTASKSLAYTKAAPTALDRAKLAHSFSNNAGLNALLGVPHNIDTVAGYTAWNTFSMVTIIGAIWAFLLATKYFRGEEETGRSELLLSGQTTARRMTTNTLAGLGVSLGLLFVIVSVLYTAIGKSPTVNIGLQQSCFFALCTSLGALLFLAVGSLTSQLMPTRSRAASLAAVIFGVFFLVRAMGDVTNARWLLDLTPLGWIENLRPLTGSQPFWLLPVFGLVALCVAATVYLSGRRDLGDSIFPDKDTARPRTRLLNSTFGATLRLTRGSILGWLTGIGLAGIFYGALTKTATQALSSFSQTGHKRRGTGELFGSLAHRAQLSNEMLYLGAIFLIMAPLVMSYAANAVGKIRDDEAQGYLDNFLVRPISRNRWLGERLLVVVCIAVLACLCSGFGVWVGEASQHGGLAFHSLILAGLNMLGAVLFTAGAGVVAIGLAPRFTTIVAYSVIGWSFLVEILGSGVNLNHWLLDTSVLRHVTLAPAVNPNWTANSILAGLGVALCVVGLLTFNKRDLAGE